MANVKSLMTVTGIVIFNQNIYILEGYIYYNMKPIQTKYGAVVKNKHGYYRVITRKEGNYNKLLHKCVVEDYYGKIPANHSIHHINMNKEDNRIENLIILPMEQHMQLHQILRGE